MSCNTSVRHNLPATETMLKYHGEIERMVYAAEIYCTEYQHKGGSYCNGKIPDCPFKSHRECVLVLLRVVVGDHHVPK
jgi:hypothetical protein